MYYVQIPANAFYFTLGFICGIVSLFCVFLILANKQEKKKKELYNSLFNNIGMLDDNDKKKN